MIVHKPEQFSLRPACVLLDLDNTLYEYAPCNAAGMAAAKEVAKQNLNIAADDLDLHFAEARNDIKSQLGKSAASHSRLLYFQRTLERAGFATEVLTTIQMENAFWTAYLAEAQLFDAVTDFLDDLRIGGIPAVIVTDLTAQIQYRKMLAFGLDGMVDAVVTSEEIGQDKPVAAAFKAALSKVKINEGGPIWMIGDDAECDLVGAKQAVGAVTLHKMHRGVHAAKRPEFVDATMHSFADIRKLLSGLGAPEG